MTQQKEFPARRRTLLLVHRLVLPVRLDSPEALRAPCALHGALVGVAPHVALEARLLSVLLACTKRGAGRYYMKTNLRHKRHEFWNGNGIGGCLHSASIALCAPLPSNVRFGRLHVVAGHVVTKHGPTAAASH